MSSHSSEIVILFEVKDSTDVHSEMRLFLMDGSLLYFGIMVVA